MKGIQVHLKKAQEDYPRKDNIRLCEQDSFQLTRHILPKDTLYYITPQEKSEAIKTYYVESGEVRILETEAVLTAGDLICCNLLDELTVLHFITAGTLVSHVYRETPEASFDRHMAALESLMQKIQDKDTYTRDHCQRVLQYVKKMGLALKYKGWSMNNLTKAARFHDIGKIYIEDSILNKPSSLDDEEFTSIQEHVALGKTLLDETFGEAVFRIVEQHHERLDGSGYPKGLKGPDISEEAKIIAICDSFDAMTSDRVYKKGVSVTDAFAELRQLAGVKYDRDLVELFICEYEKSQEA